MKKLFGAVMVAVMAVTMLTACGQPAVDVNETPSEAVVSEQPTEEVTETEDDVLTVGLIQLVEHPSLDEIRDAFTAQVEAEAVRLGLTVEIDYKNAQNDPTLINSICRQFVDDGVDVIVAIATPAAQGAASVTSDIPIVFSAITDPVGAGLVQNMDAPEGNITGTSDAIAVDKIFALAAELTPEVQSYGLIYNKGEANSVSVIAQTKEYLDSIGVTYEESTVTNEGEVQQAARVLLEKCDAVFSPIDNTVANAMPVLAQEAIAVQKPVYVAADSMVNDGGLATVGVNYTNLGTQTADMTMKVLTGTAIADIPVEVLTDANVVVNEETAAAIGVDVSAYAE